MKKEILKLRREGKTYDEIKNILGCSKSTISYHCSKNELSGYINKIDDKLVNEIKDYCKDHTIKETSIKFDISESTVKRYKNSIPNDGRSLINKSNYVINWRKRTKKKLVDYKGGKCIKCGYKKCIEALEFHHIDPDGKDFSVAGKSRSFERMKKEVDKCILLCSNCHKEIHYLN